jgi:hypothetical protein
MKRKIGWVIVATLTFIVGVVSVTSWFYFRNSGSSIQQNYTISAESESLRGSERMHVCLKTFDINLGDSFAYVDSVIILTPNPNGPNQNIAWRQGRLTDFYTIPEQQIEIDKENKLQPVICLTFDDRKRLRSFDINWSLYQDGSNSLKRKIIDVLVSRELTCMASKGIDLKKNIFKSRSDFGDYIREFKYDFSDRNPLWSVSYSMEMK